MTTPPPAGNNSNFMTVKCPQCGKETPWEGNPCRPFCSERCKLLDLGAWAAEEYRVEGEEARDEERNDGSESESPIH